MSTSNNNDRLDHLGIVLRDRIENGTIGQSKPLLQALRNGITNAGLLNLVANFATAQEDPKDLAVRSHIVDVTATAVRGTISDEGLAHLILHLINNPGNAKFNNFVKNLNTMDSKLDDELKNNLVDLAVKQSAKTDLKMAPTPDPKRAKIAAYDEQGNPIHAFVDLTALTNVAGTTPTSTQPTVATGTTTTPTTTTPTVTTRARVRDQAQQLKIRKDYSKIRVDYEEQAYGAQILVAQAKLNAPAQDPMVICAAIEGTLQLYKTNSRINKLWKTDVGEMILRWLLFHKLQDPAHKQQVVASLKAAHPFFATFTV